jgi:hypothetical protein
MGNETKQLSGSGFPSIWNNTPLPNKIAKRLNRLNKLFLDESN